VARYQSVPWVAPAVGSDDGRPAGPHEILVMAMLPFCVLRCDKCAMLGASLYNCDGHG
jgi:hypothetical protein